MRKPFVLFIKQLGSCPTRNKKTAIRKAIRWHNFYNPFIERLTEHLLDRAAAYVPAEDTKTDD